MPLFRALGLAVVLITIRIMLPDVFHAGETTAISFLHGAELSADTASSIAASAGSAKGIPNGFQTFTAPPAFHSNDPHVLSLPQAPSIPSY